MGKRLILTLGAWPTDDHSCSDCKPPSFEDWTAYQTEGLQRSDINAREIDDGRREARIQGTSPSLH